MPLIRKMPKRGFNNAAFRTSFAVVNLGDLNDKFSDGATVDEAALVSAGLIRKPYDGVKVLAAGDLHKKLSIVANKASASAKDAVEKAGGTIELI